MIRLFFLLLLLFSASIGISSPLYAQNDEDRFAIALHANTGSPPFFGVSYRFMDNLAVRLSAGYFSQQVHYAMATSRTPGSINGSFRSYWYGGATAGLYFLPSIWSFHPYTGLKFQYVYAQRPGDENLNDEALDRTDIGAILGTELRLFSWLSFMGETTLGYRYGLPGNSAILWDQRCGGFDGCVDWGFLHWGLGLQAHF